MPSARHKRLLEVTFRILELDFEASLIARDGLIRNHLDADSVREIRE